MALVLAICAGCFTSAPPPATAWTVDAAPPSGLPPAEPKPVFAATRLGGVSVLAPYDQPSFTVRRADGSLAFDPGNRFAAQPGIIAVDMPLREEMHTAEKASSRISS